MFQQWYYNQISLPMPAQGMNKFLSPDVLPPSFSYHLENILPSPVGEGQVRYGTRKINSLNNPNISVLEAFLFVKNDNTKQAVMYVQDYVADGDATDIVVGPQNEIVFQTDNVNKYVKDTYLKISYTLNGSNYTLSSKIESIEVVGDLVDIVLSGNLFPPTIDDIEVQEINYPVGNIYVYSYDEDEFNNVWNTPMSVACIPRGTVFNQTLLICNGVDKVLSWDGQTMQEVYDFVKEQDARNLARIGLNSFSFTSLPAFDQTKYFNGNLIQLSVNGVITTLTITNVVVVGALVTITTAEPVPAFDGGDIVELFYRDWPPTFNYIYAGTDRLWALGPGAAGINWRDPDQALKVYYTYVPNTITDWFNENTKTVPFVDLSKKHGIQDNLEAIIQVGGRTAFVGRNRTQVYEGSIPGDGRDLGNLGDFRWSMNIDIGTVHGNLVIDMPNDVYFISQTGLKSASTLNAAKQFAANSFNAVDPLINQFLSDVMGSDINYRSSRSFKYEQGNIAGFKLGRNKLLTSLFETNLYAWTLFSGDFQKSSTFLDTGKSLSLFIGDSIYQYADGRDGSNKVYGDNDGESVIPFSWIPGLINKSVNSFACKRYQLIMKYPSGFPLNDSNKVKITVNGDTPSTVSKSDVCEFEEKGDVFGGAPLAPDYTEENGYFKLNKDYSFLVKRFKFASSRFWIMLNGYTLTGPLYIREIKLFGS